MPSNRSYTADELEVLLLEHLEDDEFMTVSTVGPVDRPASELAALNRREQELLLTWIGRVVSVQEQVGYEFTLRSARALRLMGEEGMTAWLRRIMDIYDKAGLYPAMQLLRGMESHAERFREGRHELEFREVRGVLEGFLAGLSGRRLRLDVADAGPYTDSTRVFVPASVFHFRDPEDNFSLFKAMVAHHWAQVRFGTVRLRLQADLASFADRDKALAVLLALERFRLDACIERELPGLGRTLREVCEKLEHPGPEGVWKEFAEHLRQPGRQAEDSLELLADAYTEPAEPAAYQGLLRPDQIAEATARRQKEEREMLARLLGDFADKPQGEQTPAKPPGRDTRSSRFRAETDMESLEIELYLDDQPVAPPIEVSRLLQSVALDFGEIPDDFLHPSGDGYRGGERGDAGEDGARAVAGTLRLYPEWDYKRQHYRKEWCSVRELPVRPREDDFVARTRDKYLPLIRQLKRTFEALRGEDRRLKRQPYGDEVDLDAVVEAYADARSGQEVSPNLFTRLHRVERDIAVLFMVDMSGSTRGWINDAERESLILLCEALEKLGDRYGIYGFSGMTRTRCEIYPVKALDEPYSDEVRGRISAIEPKDYTRMGAAIRHLSAILGEVEARTRLLVTLSDGKPDDFDAYYRGEYGIEDTRRALIEARRAGIHPFCITIDTEGPDYLPHMYGPVNYTVVDEVARLPRQVADIYRKLTS